MTGDARAELALTRARTELLLGHPFFGSMALRLVFTPDPECADIWTDGLNLGFNPGALAGRDEGEIAAMLAHAMLHLACEHHLRRGERDSDLWNRACDLAINGLLVEAGFTLPRGYPVDKAQGGKPAEAIYAALLGDLDEKGDGRGGGEAAEPRTLGGDPGEAGDQGAPSQALRAGSASGSVGGEEPGGERRKAQAGGKGRAQDSSGDRDSPLAGEVRDHPELAGEPSQARRKDLAARLRQDVSQSLRGAAGMGDLPAGLVRLLGELSSPRLDWTELLRRFVMERAVNDYSWSPPSRRHAHAGLCLPSARSMALGDVVLAVDTSGSVDDTLLRRFFSEFEAVLAACDTRLFLYCCDAQAGEPAVLTRADRMDAPSPRGGGGTDYRPVFARVESDGARPACLIYLTDFECDRFPEPPAYPVLWAVPEPARTVPPFGEVLRLR